VVWRVLADAIEAGLDKTERVLIRDGKIVVHWRKAMPDGPTLHLDADADETILKAMYPQPQMVRPLAPAKVYRGLRVADQRIEDARAARQRARDLVMVPLKADAKRNSEMVLRKTARLRGKIRRWRQKERLTPERAATLLRKINGLPMLQEAKNFRRIARKALRVREDIAKRTEEKGERAKATKTLLKKRLRAWHLANPQVVRAELRPRAEVVQVTDQTFSKRALIGTPEAPDGAGKRAEICRLVRVEVMHDRAQRGGGVLCVASKGVVAQIFADAGAGEPKLGAELHGATWIWFGPASKGLNNWRDFCTVIEIGREELPPSAIEDQARGLFGDGPEPLQFPAPDERGNVLPPKVVLPILMTNGQALGMLGRAYADKRLRALQRQSREGAGRQGAERLRMAHSIGQKRWLRLNNVPLDTVPVAEVTTWGDLLPDRLTGAVADAAQRQGFLRLSAKGLAQDAPAEFSTVKAAEKWLAAGYTPRTPSKDSIRGTGGITAQMKVQGQRGPTPTRVIIPAAPCSEAAKAALEQVLGPLAHFEVLETVPTCADKVVTEQVKRLENIVKAVGYTPKVTVRCVESPAFVSGQIPSGDLVAAFQRHGWPAILDSRNEMTFQ
jgi:hypothetical protein